MLVAAFFITICLLTALLLYLSYTLFYEHHTKNSHIKSLHEDISNRDQSQQNRELHLKQKAYHAEVLRELSERIGYSLNVSKIIEVITGSLQEVLEYSTASYMIKENNHIVFHSYVAKSVNHNFIKDTQLKMLSAFSKMLNTDISSVYIEEAISGTILNNTADNQVGSYFNLPLVIEGKILGIITIASPSLNIYDLERTKILYTITQEAARHYEKLKLVLEEERRKLNAMVASMEDGVIMLDRSLRIIVFNPSAIKILQLTNLTEPTIKDITDSLQGIVDLRTKLDEAIRNEHVTEQEDIIIHNRAYHLLITPVKDSRNELIGTAILLRDVTAEKELVQMRDEFTAKVVHELRAPLTTIRGTTDMLVNESKLTEEVKKKLLLTMKEDSEHMLKLVGEILDVSKIEAGKFQIEPTLGKMQDIVEKAVGKFTAQATKKGVSMTVQSDPATPEIKFDIIRIEQVLNNLISNAIKYTDKGTITVSVHPETDKGVVIEIIDTGAGLNEEEVKGLFSKFKQFGKGKTGKVKGTGLGLVIAKGIIESHLGRIEASSEGPGKGSTFKFWLPLQGPQGMKGGNNGENIIS